MVIAAGLDIDVDTAIADGSYDYLKIAFNADADASIAAGGAVNIIGFTNIGDDGTTTLANTGSLSIDGALTTNTHVYVGGNGTATPTASFNIGASGSVAITGNFYGGGITVGASGNANVTVNGTASFTASSGINIGWISPSGYASSGELTIVGSGGVIQANQIQIKQGTVHFIVDAAGVTPLTSTASAEDATHVIAFYGGVIPGTVIDMSFVDAATQAAYDAMTWDDPGRWVVLADASYGTAGSLQWDGIPNYTGAILAGDPKWELVERTNNILEAHYMVPEPTTMALLGLGGLLAALRRRS